MSDEEPKAAAAKGGRPLKDASKGKRAKYGFRMADSTRHQLEGFANDSGRSLSEEVEYRIEQSLQKDRRLNAVLTMLGGAEMVSFATLAIGDLRLAIDDADAKVQSVLPWYESPEKLDLVQEHMGHVVGRAVSTYARMLQTGVAARTGQHLSSLAD